MSFLDGFFSLGRNTNKVAQESDETKEGIISELSPELTLDREDKELSDLAKKWLDTWNKSEAKVELERKQKENEKYWKGDHHTPAQKTSGKRELIDNLVFEAVETGLPFYTKQVADPMVESDDTPEGKILARKVNDRIKDVADTIRLRLKVKKAVRHWALYYLGVVKLGWSLETNEIAVQVRRPQQMILDPNAITDECEYEGEYAGEYRSETAKELIARFPEKTEYITDLVNKQLGTKLRYIEWWTTEILFWTLESEVLGKVKNPHWNYDVIKQVPETIDEFGAEVPASQEIVQGANHFSSSKIPYALLSVFTLGTKPFDETNQVEQILPLQDVVNKRQRQIDRNADSMNAGAVVSGEAFTKEQAKQVGDALRRGLTVYVPRGDVNRVYKRDTGQPIPDFVYQSLVDYRNEIRNIFGVSGLSAQGIKKEETVRGKILVRAADADRNPLTDHLEQFYDYIYNWFVQLMYVYYDEPHKVSRYQGTDTIASAELTRPLVVSVKEGSLIPKDRLTMRNEAVDLWTAKALDPLTLFERLEDPNPIQSAQRLVTWMMNPAAYAATLGVQPAPAPVPAEETGAPAPEEQPVESQNLLNQVPIS